MGVFVVAFVVIAAFGRHGYYVGFQDDAVVVFQGRPEGVLWFKPTVESVSEVTRAELTPEFQSRIAGHPTFDSSVAARRYVEQLAENQRRAGRRHDHDDRGRTVDGRTVDGRTVDRGGAGLERGDHRAVISQVRRSTELGLIILAAIITAGAYVLAALGRTSTLPANLVPFLVVILGLLLVAHLATRRFAPGADGTLLPLAALLNGLGYVFIARVDTDLAGLQATWTLVAIGAYVATLFVVRRVPDLARYKWTFALIGIVLLLLPFVPGVGFAAPDGARLWVSVGPINFQPGEFAKLALALFFAAYLTERRELLAAGTWKVGPFHLPEPRHLGPLFIAWGASLVVLIGQKDLGSSLLFFALFVVLLWVATERVSWLAIGAVLFAAGSFVAWNVIANVQDRVDVWLDPWQTARRQGLPARAEHVRPRVGRSSPAPGSASATRPASPRSRTTSSSRPSARSSGCSAGPRSSSPTC